MKKTILSLVLVLILALQAVPALASDNVFAPIGQTETKAAGTPIDVNSVVDMLNGLELLAGTADKNCIAPFLNLTWKDVETYDIDCKIMDNTPCVTSGGISYFINARKADLGAVSGTIVVKNDNRALLVGVWKDLGEELIAAFGEPEEIEGINEKSQMCYTFENDETFVRFEFMDSDNWRYILFVIMPR